MNDRSSSPEFFEAKYQATQDPWSFATSPAELTRYQAILAALSGRHYRRAFEPACSIGVLTEQLASQCDQIFALDISATAAKRASDRCAHLPHVDVQCGSIESVHFAEPLDLLLLSEIGYYFQEEQWSLLVHRLLDFCTPDCTVISSHWLGTSMDHQITGDQVHASLRRQSRLVVDHEERHHTFRLDRFSLVRP